MPQVPTAGLTGLTAVACLPEASSPYFSQSPGATAGVLGSDADGPRASRTVARGDDDTVAVKMNGGLWAWGFNGNGELGLGDTRDRGGPTLVSGGP
jgi:hypothetical protein